MKAGDIVANLKLKINDFEQGLSTAQGKMERFKQKTQNTAKVFKTVGATVAGFGTIASVGLGSAVKTAADFEQAMSRVGALSGASGKDLQAMTAKAKELGATTSFSASQAAEGMQYLAMAGYATNDIIAAMPGVLNMAAAGQIELGDAANIASNIMSAFGIEASKTGDVADVLSKTFTSSNTTLQGLGETMKYVAPAAKSVGWELEDMAAATGMLGNVGIDASMAGTALRSAVTRLAAPTKVAKDLMKEYGINITDANGKMLPLPDILAQMKQGFGDMTDAQRAAAVQTIFGTESMSAMLALMEDPQGLRTYAEELRNAGGTAEEIANKQLDNLNGAVTQLKSAFEGAQIAIGTALIPAIRVLAEWLTSLVSWFNGLSQTTQNTIAIVGALSAVLAVLGGGLLVLIGFLPQLVAGFGLLATGLGFVGTAFSALGTAVVWLFTTPFGLAIVAIAGLVAAFVMLSGHGDVIIAKLQSLGLNMDTFRNFIEAARLKLLELWTAFQNSVVFEVLANLISMVITKVQDFANAIMNLITTGDFTPLLQAFQALIPTIIGLLMGGVPKLVIMGLMMIQNLANGMGMSVPELIQKVADLIVSMINKFVAMLPQMIQTGVQILTSLIQGIVQAIPKILNAVTQVITTLTNMIGTLLPIVIEAGIKILMSLIQGIIKLLPQLANTALTLINTVVDMLITLLPMIIAAGISILLALIDGILQILPQLINTALQLITSIVMAITQALPAIISAGIQILFALIKGILQILPQLISAILQLVVAIVKTLISNLPQILEAGVKLILALIKGILSVLGAVGKAALTIGKEVLKQIKTIDLKEVGKNLIKGLWNGIGSMSSWLSSKLSGFSKNVLKDIKSFFGIHSPSRVFRDEIGVNLMKGLQVGIDNESDSPVKSLNTVVGNVLDGAKSVKGAFDGLGNLKVSTPQIGNISSGIDVGGVFDGTDNKQGGGGTQYHAPIVQVENMNVRDEQDVRNVSRELFSLQRNHDRSQGGR